MRYNVCNKLKFKWNSMNPESDQSKLKWNTIKIQTFIILYQLSNYM